MNRVQTHNISDDRHCLHRYFARKEENCKPQLMDVLARILKLQLMDVLARILKLQLMDVLARIATFNNISVIQWWSVLLVEETGVPRENN
jgi:hypothetical protein